MKKNQLDIHTLYEASVQSVDENLRFLKQAFKDQGLHKPNRICEDFCGTARLATEWVKRKKKHQAVGVDFDQSVLDWGAKHHHEQIDESQRERLQIIHGDVLTVEMETVEAILAFNFSYFIFKKREQLLDYFKKARNRLQQDGALVLDFYGGSGSYKDVLETRGISGRKTSDGKTVPDFAYEWEQTRFNAVTHEVTCYIHFELSLKNRIEKAFRYDWRLWTLPELQELLIEAGFSSVGVYTHGWDRDGESDDRFIKQTHFENEESWLAYLVAWNSSEDNTGS